MKDLFYLILVLLFVSWVLIIRNIDNIEADISQLEEYNGWIVTNKENNNLFSNYITIRNDTLKYKFKSDDIIYMKYEVGDTIQIQTK